MITTILKACLDTGQAEQVDQKTTPRTPPAKPKPEQQEVKLDTSATSFDASRRFSPARKVDQSKAKQRV